MIRSAAPPLPDRTIFQVSLQTPVHDSRSIGVDSLFPWELHVTESLDRLSELAAECRGSADVTEVTFAPLGSESRAVNAASLGRGGRFSDISRAVALATSGR